MTSVEMHSENLHFRTFEERDLPGILRLWRTTGWGEIDAATWRSWHVEGPNGADIVGVVVDDKQDVLGQVVLSRCALSVSGHRVDGVRVVSPIVLPELRGRALDTKAGILPTLVAATLRHARSSRIEVFYAIPDRGFIRIMRRDPGTHAGLFGCVALNARTARPTSRLWVSEVNAADINGTEYDRLWSRACGKLQFTCGAIRSAAWVRYRHGHHLLLEVRSGREGPLVGYVAIRRRDSLLMDALAEDEDAVLSTIQEALGWLGTNTDSTYVRAMSSPTLRPILDGLESESVDYEFGFATGPLGPSVSLDQLAPSNWYLTPAG